MTKPRSAQVDNVVNVLKISQKEKISSTVTPQQAFDDMRDLSTNSITENSEKVNTLDEKNSKSLNDEAPIGAEKVDKHSQYELEAKVANVVNIEHDFSGYSMQINGSAVSHIQKRHGKNGNADQKIALKNP